MTKIGKLNKYEIFDFKSPNTVFDLTAKTCKSNDSYSKRNLPNNMKLTY